MKKISNKKFDSVVIGNVGIDTNVYGSEVKFSGESNFTENVDYVGQAGGYASRGYSQLRKKTAFIGYVGDDFSGRFIRDEFARDGIDTTALFIDPFGTSRSVNVMSPDGRRKNFYDGKGHMNLLPDLKICKAVLAKTKLAHFNIPNWARHLLPVAKELGVTIACDLQDVVTADDPYRQDFIKYADILFFSAANHQNPTALMKTFLKSNPSAIVIAGMGAEGCALCTRTQVEYFAPVTMDLPVIDTNGAGDGLAVGFLSSYVLDQFELRESIQRGQITARFTCAQKGSSSSLITKEKLDRYFQAHLGSR
ncbi:MAG: carbohydrate kinase family protein [Bacteroidota bacterium]